MPNVNVPQMQLPGFRVALTDPGLGPVITSVSSGTSTDIPITGLQPGEYITSATGGTPNGTNITVNLSSFGRVFYQTNYNRTGVIGIASTAATPVPVAQGLPTVTGGVSVGKVLTAVHPAYTNSPSTVSGQWERSGVAISGATSLTYTQVAADAGKNITFRSTASNAAGTSSPARSAASLCGSISRKRVGGSTTSTSNTSSQTIHQTCRVAADFDSIQVILHVGQVNLPSGPIRMVIAPSAYAGYNPKDGSNANIAWTPVTFGGTQSLTVANAPANSDGSTPESDYISDILPISSLARADTAGLPPLVMARIQSPGYCPCFIFATGNPDATSEPEFVSGNYSGDNLTTVTGAAPSSPSYYTIAMTIICYHRGVKVMTIGASGDSTMQGSYLSANAVDGTSSKFYGFHRQLCAQFTAAGIPVSLEQTCVHGEPSSAFHPAALAKATSGIGSDRFELFYPWSINDNPNTQAAYLASQTRVNSLIDALVSAGIQPVLVRNPPGYESSIGQANGYNEYLASVASAGKATVYDCRPAVGLAASGYPGMPDAYALHDSSGVARPNGDSHPNNLYHQTIAADMYSKRVALKLVMQPA